MDVNPRLQSLFQRLDTNHDKGVSVAELKKLDGDHNGQIDEAEAMAQNIRNPEDLNSLNEALQRGSSMAPTEILFPLDLPESDTGAQAEEPPPAEENHGQLMRMTDRAFNPSEPSIQRRMTRLNQVMGGILSDQMDPSGFSYRTPPKRSQVANLDVYSDAVRGVQTFDDLRQVTRDTVSQQLSADLGRDPTAAEVDAYIQQHGEDMAQLLGDDLSGKYSSATSIGLTGDVGTLDPYRSSGPDDDSVVVCTNIHASVAAYRQEVLGQEAYVMQTDGNDQAHIVTVFKDNDTQTWNIQNYGNIVQTDAKDLRELYEKYLPEQRHIILGSVDDKSVHMERDVRTALGEREYRDRTQLGYGQMNPEANALDLNTREISVQHGNWNVQYDRDLSTVMFNHHNTTRDEDGIHTQGWAVAAQDHTNEVGYRRQRLDAKYEGQTTAWKQVSEGHEQLDRQYWNVHAGVEDVSEPGQIYWPNADDTGAAARLGARYMFDRTHLLGTGDLRTELGWGVNLGTTLTMGTAGKDFYSTYISRTLNDTEASGHGNVGLRYDHGPWTARTGLTLGADLANINGFSDFGMQMHNIAQAGAYGEVDYTGDRVRMGAMGQADLMHPGVFDVAAMADLSLTDRLSWTSTVSHQHDPLLGNRTGAMTGLQMDIGRGFSGYAQVGGSLQGEVLSTAGLVWRPGEHKHK